MTLQEAQTGINIRNRGSVNLRNKGPNINETRVDETTLKLRAQNRHRNT